jgi:PTS system ascorbate-specific IIA component
VSVGILIVAHSKLGHVLTDIVGDLIGPLPLITDVLEVRRVQATDVLLRQGSRMIERLDSGDGVLLLTDVYGSTPSNIATHLGAAPRVMIVSGVNLPMLLRVYNYPALDLPQLAQYAIEGGQRGIALSAGASTIEPKGV